MTTRGGSSVAGSLLHVVPSPSTFWTHLIHGTGLQPRAWLPMPDDVAVHFHRSLVDSRIGGAPSSSSHQDSGTTACWSADRWSFCSRSNEAH